MRENDETPKLVADVAPTGLPSLPAKTEIAEAHAIRALFAGEATSDQQLRFVRWLERATGMTDLSYRAKSDRDTSFAEGKRFIGLQFFSLAKNQVTPPRQG